MGKTWLYHPVSLMTIRGAAAQIGFELGRITQTNYNFLNGQANYRAEIKACPPDFLNIPQWKQITLLNSCFAADVWVGWVGHNVHGKLCVNFRTHVEQDVEDQTPAVEGEGEGAEIVDPYYD